MALALEAPRARTAAADQIRKENEMNGLSEEIFESDYEGGFEGEEEYADQEAGDYESESEWGYQGEEETGFGDGEGPFSEQQEIELAAELLSVSQDQELDQFLGNLI